MHYVFSSLEGSVLIIPAGYPAHKYASLLSFQDFIKSHKFWLGNERYTATVVPVQSGTLLSTAATDINYPFAEIASGQRVEIGVCWLVFYLLTLNL